MVMLFDAPAPLSADFSRYYFADEQECIDELRAYLQLSPSQIEQAQANSLELIEAVRATDAGKLSLESFLHEYPLHSDEGRTLMCLAEALLRIPDRETAQRLVNDKLKQTQWQAQDKSSDSIFINASTWALRIGGSLIGKESPSGGKMTELLGQLTNRYTEPMVLAAIKHAMRLVGSQFVFAQSIEQACKAINDHPQQSYSFDMLGEAALCRDDATAYFAAYEGALAHIATTCETKQLSIKPSLSIKLSALHPNYRHQNQAQVKAELIPQLQALLLKAKLLEVEVTLDAEEADVLELQLEIYQQLLELPEFKGWQGLGIAVQAYSKRAMSCLHFVQQLAERLEIRLPIRLVKGAYWDSEVKQAQELGLEDYPVFTSKAATDISYLACAKYLFENQQHFYPAFATHNAQTLSSVLDMATEDAQFEFQRLHGMGESLYDKVLEQYPNSRLRIYAPVGKHKTLLPYLVRRILENGANTSFVQQLVDSQIDSRDLARHPLEQIKTSTAIAKPAAIYQPHRANASSWYIGDRQAYGKFATRFKTLINDYQSHTIGPVINGQSLTSDEGFEVSAPANRAKLAYCYSADAEQIHQAIDHANLAFGDWQQSPVDTRAQILEQFAQLLQQQQDKAIELLILEAGKSLQDAISEVQEAINFAHYYAEQAVQLFQQPEQLASLNGEHNQLNWRGRGVFVCISPWNFPASIFIGQICAALAAGNCVIAKPAEQTPMIAYWLTQRLLEAGVPPQVLHLCPGNAYTGRFLCQQDGIHGIAFTGSLLTAKDVQQNLYQHHNNLLPLIAETGGQNALIVDSSAQIDQLVKDVIHSAFNSAGQRCSALRIIYLQEEMADEFYQALIGAMAELKLGPGHLLDSDIGPIIDRMAMQKLQSYLNQQVQLGRLLYQSPMPLELESPAAYLPPTVLQCNDIKDLVNETFGPVLHICRYASQDLDKVIRQINSAGFGLTLGIYSRNEKWALELARQLNIGNIYINRPIIAAAVGAQPFGGMNLSGSGTKAGGPYTLQSFAYQVCISHNLSAIGGTVSNNSVFPPNDEAN